tara:strand:- start:487 stop:2289 length:1803 start_codon:yes stop_codon:yes gene_type:complete
VAKKHVVRRKIFDDNYLTLPLSTKLKQIYASRGVSSPEELSLKVSQMCPVDSLKGIDQACEVLHNALVQQDHITIIGDFDADGATSTALMMEALTLLGSQHHDFLVPNRFEYGYGLTPEIVEVAAKQGAKLLITVDNGISCVAGVARAKALGLNVIVTDHHLPGKVQPNADAIVNPNQHGCNFPSKALAGVGVAFYFMLAQRKYLREKNWFTDKHLPEPNIAQLLDLVALGTVADVVPLDANNRILINQGLKRIRAGQTRPGIEALIEISGRNQQRLIASDFGFALAPRINAAGRLDDMSFGINCLLAKDLMTARPMASDLDELNKARREIEQGMQTEAETIFKQLSFSDENLPSAIALYHQEWHQGVIGIVAGRLKEKYHRPSIVFANAKEESYGELEDKEAGAVEDIELLEAIEDNAEIKGSARSIPGLHIRDLLEHISSQHPDLILKFGGHAMAAGLSIKKRDFDKFQQVFDQLAKKWLKEEDLIGVILSDGELALSELTLDFAEQLRNAGPWGQNFSEPLFDDTFTLIQQRIVGEKHLKITVQKQDQLFDGIIFNIDIKAWPNPQAKNVHLAYKLDVNEFRGKRTVQLMVEDISLA